MPDRSPAPSSRLREVPELLRRYVVGPLRPVLATALSAAAVAGVLAALGGALVAARQPDHYVARATFTLVTRADAVAPLSTNRSLLAEQNARYLRSGRAAGIAREAAGGGEFRAEWVAGPGHGQLSYQVTSDDPALATRVAQAVFDQAGFLGTRLGADPATAPALDLDAVDPATPTRTGAPTVVVTAAALGAVAGFFLILLVAVRPRPATTGPRP